MFRAVKYVLFVAIGFTIFWYFLDMMVTVSRFKFRHWRSFFIWEGVHDITYLIASSIIFFLWRPNDNNQRFAYSQQINQTDDENVSMESVDNNYKRKY